MLDLSGRIICSYFQDICTDRALVNYRIYIFQPAITSHKIILYYIAPLILKTPITHIDTVTEPPWMRKLNKYLTSPNKIIQCFKTSSKEERHCYPVIRTQTKDWEIPRFILTCMITSSPSWPWVNELNPSQLWVFHFPYQFTEELFLGPKTRKDFKGLLLFQTKEWAYIFKNRQLLPQTSTTKGKIVNILGFEGHMISVVTTQLCHFSHRQ